MFFYDMSYVLYIMSYVFYNMSYVLYRVMYCIELYELGTFFNRVCNIHSL